MMDDRIYDMKLKSRKEYLIKVVRSEDCYWHRKYIGHKFKAIYNSGGYFTVKVDGKAMGYISKKYCRIVQDTPTDEIKKVRSVRCL